MKLNVDVDYRSPLTFQLPAWITDTRPQDDVAFEPLATEEEVSRTDLGYFMSVAGRFDLLSRERERVLGFVLWRARLRLLRVLRMARRGRSRRELETIQVSPHERALTASTRRRLMRVEAAAVDIVTRFEEDRGRSTARWLTPPQARAVAPVLRACLGVMTEVRREMLERNLRLVIWVAKAFRGRGFDFIDLIQEGSLGLLRAIDRFDPLFGVRFSTFATHWIKQGIRRALAEKGRAIRIPVNRISEVRDTLAAHSCLVQKLDRVPLPEELAAELGVPVSKVKELLPAIAPIDSIDAPLPFGDRDLADTLEDRSRPTPLEEAIDEELCRTVNAALSHLPERQRVILSMRHGIGYPKESTLEEIGKAIGLSRERVRQLEKTAVAQIRELLAKLRPHVAEC